MIRTYLDWLIAVPWGKRSEEHLDPVAARAVLDADHAGLEDVKDRVTEYLAVRKLRQDRGIEADPKSGAILTLIGPPGTGKTSIGESIARATGREFVRMSLGGVRDEAEIRGHRRTYIGALPGRLVRALRDAGHDEPGDPARRGRQGRRGLARGPLRGAARGARPGAEPLLPRPLPRRRARPQPGHVPRHGQRGRHDPRTAARPHGGDPLRRLHLRGEARDREGLPVAAPARPQRPARGRGRDLRRGAAHDHRRVHARGRRPQPRARARHGAAQDRDEDRLERQTVRRRRRRRAGEEPTEPKARVAAKPESNPREDRPGGRARRARTPEVLPGVGGAHRDPRRGDRPGRDRRRRRRPVRRGDRDEGRLGRQRARADRPARRRDEGVGADRALLRARPRRGARHRRAAPSRSKRVPRPRARRRDPQGRPERGRDDGHRARLAADRAAGQAHRRDDRRGHAAGPGAADRRAQAEGARGPRRRPDRRDPARAQPRRPRRHPRGGPRADDLPPGDDRPGGPRPRTGAGARCRAVS